MSFVVISTRLQQKMLVLMKQLKIVKEIQYEEKLQTMVNGAGICLAI